MEPVRGRVPVEALYVGARLESFCWRIEQLVGEGGFALVTGLPGVGKSVTLRVLAERLSAQRDVQLGVLSRPQAHTADFYRELGDLFGVALHPHNRWAGAKLLRERWQGHIDAALCRPVLIVDEAQEMHLSVLSELRLLMRVRGVRASGERHRDVVPSLLCRLLDGRAAAEDDHVGERDPLPPDCDALKSCWICSRRLQRLASSARLIDLPVPLWRQADPRPVRPAALVGAAEAGRRRPGGGNQPGDRQSRVRGSCP